MAEPTEQQPLEGGGEAVEQLTGLTATSREDAEHALLAARGNLDLAVQFLLEGMPAQIGHIVAPESRRVAAGPGHLTLAPPQLPTPHRLIAKARALPGGYEALNALLDAARSGQLVKARPTLEGVEYPLLDELAPSHLPLLRLICEQPQSFALLLSEDWRSQARKQAQQVLAARQDTVKIVRARVSRSHAAVTAATIEAAVAGFGEGAEVARHDAARAVAGHRRLQASLERAEAAAERAAAELKVAVEAETLHLREALTEGAIRALCDGHVAQHAQTNDCCVQLVQLGDPGRLCASDGTEAIYVKLEPDAGEGWKEDDPINNAVVRVQRWGFVEKDSEVVLVIAKMLLVQCPVETLGCPQVIDTCHLMSSRPPAGMPHTDGSPIPMAIEASSTSDNVSNTIASYGEHVHGASAKARCEQRVRVIFAELTSAGYSPNDAAREALRRAKEELSGGT